MTIALVQLFFCAFIFFCLQKNGDAIQLSSHTNLVTEGKECVIVSLDVRLDVLDGLGGELILGLLLLVPCTGLDGSFGFKSGDSVLVGPAHFVGDSTDGAVLSVWAELGDSKCGWDNHLLLLVVWGWAAVEGLQTVHGGLATGSLVWDHASDGSPEDL